MLMPPHLRPYVPVKPRESALGHRLPSQTNTCLFCTLCPHSCAPGNNFPVGHPSPNCFGPSTLNLGVLWRPAFGEEVATCWYEYPINPIKPWAGVSHAHPLRRSPTPPPKPPSPFVGGALEGRVPPTAPPKAPPT